MSSKKEQLAEKLKQLSPEQRQALLKKLKSKEAATSGERQAPKQLLSHQPIARLERNALDHYPLSFAQQRLWFLNQLEGDSSAYNIAAGLELNGDLDSAALEQAFKQCIHLNESLRTHFIETPEGPVQAIMPQLDWHLVQETIDEQALGEALKQQANTVFTLSAAPLFRVCLFKLSATRAVLSIVVHHIISDGWSNQLLLKQLSAAYNDIVKGGGLSKDELLLQAASVCQYVDFSAYQQQLVSEQANAQLSFWQDVLANNENLDICPDYDRSQSALIEADVAQVRLHIDAPCMQTFFSQSLSQQATPFLSLLAVYHLLLMRYSRQYDFAIGMPVSGRNHQDTEAIQGLFVNSQAVPCQINEDDEALSFTQLLMRLRDFMLASMGNSDIPFERIVEHVVAERNLESSPLFQAFFAYDQDAIEQFVNFDDIDTKYLPVDIEQKKFTFNLNIKDANGGIDCLLEYDPKRYCAKRMQAMLTHFKQLVLHLSENFESDVLRLDFLSASERNYLIEQNVDCVNHTAYSHPETFDSIHQWFETSAKQHAQNIAVEDAEQSLSYAELNNVADQLAFKIANAGEPQQNSFKTVAVCLERSVAMSVALLASLKTGAAYLPLLSDMPIQRMAYILEDAACEIILVDDVTATLLQTLAQQKNIQLMNVQQFIQKADASTPVDTNSLSLAANNAQVFNIIYTSGSTGKPKGVVVPHSGIVNRLQWMQKQYPMTVSDIVLQKTPFNFDVSVWELFWPLLVGAKLHFAKADGHKDPEYLREIIAEQKVSLCHFVPSMLEVFLQVDNLSALHSLRHVFCSGEALLQAQLDSFYQRLPRAKLSNLYGPTEASIDVSYYDTKAGDTSFNQMVSIGKPIDNTQMYILDRQLNPMPRGCAGDLYLSGQGLALGYLNLPEQSAKAFIDHPFISGEKLYKTGDIARINLDGHFDYLGRSDKQVKLRGLRIELGEIEQQLLQIDLIEQAVVQLVEINQVAQIVAYIVSRSEDAVSLEKRQLNQALNQALRQALPEYMLPFDYIVIDELPLSANGKLDRKRLPVYQQGEKTNVPARNEMDVVLLEICSALLKKDVNSIADNFFELGGHSLLATQLIMQLKQRLEIELPLKSVFELSDIAALSDLLSAIAPVDDEEGGELLEDDFEEGVL